MDAALKTHNWTAFLKLFNEQNSLRPTRLGVFEDGADAANDYWIEDNLPLAGVDLDARAENAPVIEIMLGGDAADGSRHLTHTVQRARLVKIVLSAHGKADGLEIEDSEGKTTVLRFED
jgi:hypothetical protein